LCADNKICLPTEPRRCYLAILGAFGGNPRVVAIELLQLTYVKLNFYHNCFGQNEAIMLPANSPGFVMLKITQQGSDMNNMSEVNQGTLRKTLMLLHISKAEYVHKTFALEQVTWKDLCKPFFGFLSALGR